MASLIEPLWDFLDSTRNPKCRHCRKRLKGKARGPYNAAFNGISTAYCDRCGRSLHYSPYGECNKRFDYCSSLDASHEKAEVVEKHLVPCACGGRYRFMLPICPECKKPLREAHEMIGMCFEIEPALDEEKGDKILKD